MNIGWKSVGNRRGCTSLIGQDILSEFVEFESNYKLLESIKRFWVSFFVEGEKSKIDK